MGLSRAEISWLLEESLRRPFEGTLLTLGVQNVFLSQQEFEAIADRMGVRLPVPGPETQAPLIEGTVTSEHVFTRLGFDQVVTTDVDDFEGCDFIFDLNSNEVPPEHAGAYDMVLDAGTFEHVFHLPNAFRNAIAFTKTPGRIVHFSPSSNHIDHGFWMFSPTAFWDYYTANGFTLPSFDLYRYKSPEKDGSLADFGSYRPGSLAKRMFGGLGGGCFAIALVAEKQPDSRGDVIPQQGMYVSAWASKAAPGLAAAGAAPSRSRSRHAWIMLRTALARRLPLELRIRWRAFTRNFPLKIRKRY